MTTKSATGARRLGLAAGIAALALTLAACGEDSSASSGSGGSGGSGGGDATTGADTVVQVGDDGLLVDGAGMTLYTADVEENGEIHCVDACAEFWIPLTVSTETVTAPEGVSGLSTVERPEGDLQVTYDGAPLYTFSLDTAAGDTQGGGFADDFGGQHFVWSAVDVEGAAPDATDAPTSAPGGGGYGGY